MTHTLYYNLGFNFQRITKLQQGSMGAYSVTHSPLTLCNPMDCSPPVSFVHGIFQARVLEWGAIAFSDDQPRQHIKSRDITPPAKIHVVKAMFFGVVMHGCESDYKET